MPILATGEGGIPTLLLIGVAGIVAVGSLFAGLCAGLSKDRKKRRTGTKLVFLGALATIILFTAPWIMKIYGYLAKLLG